MKKIISLILAAALCAGALTVLGGCSDYDGDMQQYIEDQELSDYMPSATDGDISQLITSGGDIVPEALIGTWEPEGIYQCAAASDISEELALELEEQFCVSFGYASFVRNGDDITNALFRVSSAEWSDMENFGIQTVSLKNKYGEDARITSISVSTSDDIYCTTVFLINDSTLVSFGTGMNVFTYNRMEAVG